MHVFETFSTLFSSILNNNAILDVEHHIFQIITVLEVYTKQAIAVLVGPIWPILWLHVSAYGSEVMAKEAVLRSKVRQIFPDVFQMILPNHVPTWNLTKFAVRESY